MTEDPFNLERFVHAQSDTFESAIGELRNGRKRTHWMWFVFPQLRGLGRSSTAQFYGIASRDEAAAYLAHPILGPRLELATRTVLASQGLSLREIFGSPDDLKFHSSMSLFAMACPAADNPFRAALDRWFAGKMDDASVDILKG